MHETCRRRRLNKTVAPHHRPARIYVHTYIHIMLCVCIIYLHSLRYILIVHVLCTVLLLYLYTMRSG